MKKKYVTCHDVNGKLRRVRADTLFFRPSIYGVIIERGKVLLSKQWDGYDFPGGGSDLHETITQTLKREMWEETGLRVEPIKLLWAGNSFFTLAFEKKHANCILLYYLCKRVGGKLSTKNFDVHEKTYAHMAEWVSLTKCKRLKFYNSVDNVKILRLARQATK